MNLEFQTSDPGVSSVREPRFAAKFQPTVKMNTKCKLKSKMRLQIQNLGFSPNLVELIWKKRV